MPKQFTRDWHTSRLPVWRKVLGPYAGAAGIHGLEIGSFEGRSACWLLDHILTGRGAVLECVDRWAQADPGVERRFIANTAEYGRRLRRHKAESLGWLCGRLATGKREEFDFIYIDGAHEAAPALADVVLAWELLKPGGLLLFDDYPWNKPEVARPPRHAIDGFLAAHADWEPVHEGWQKIVRKVAGRPSPQPAVTAVMVTGHDPRRRPLALHTARQFTQQTYAEAELLIVNQGGAPLLPEPIPRVREVQAGAGLVVGALRNLAWEFAEGDLMACWDDDDIHHPERIAYQVSSFRDRPLALRRELFLHLHNGEAFTLERQGGFENSLLWPRGCRSRYSEKPRGSDADFHHRLTREFGRVSALANRPNLYVRLFHGRNVWHEDHFFRQPRRQAAEEGSGVRLREPTEEQRRLLQGIRAAVGKLVPAGRG